MQKSCTALWAHSTPDRCKRWERPEVVALASCQVSYVDVTDLEQVTAALTERALWVQGPSPDGDLLRGEIRHACRARGIHVRTGVGPRWASLGRTPDGLPAEEPWCGAAVHAAESGMMDEAVADLFERVYGSADDGHPQP